MLRRLERLEEHFRREWERLEPADETPRGEYYKAIFADWFENPDALNWEAFHVSWLPYWVCKALDLHKHAGYDVEITEDMIEEWDAEGQRLEELELPEPVVAIEVKPPTEPGQTGLSERIAEKYGLERKARSISMLPDDEDEELLDGPVLAQHKPLDPDAPLPLA